MYSASYIKQTLHFINPAGTSRGVLTSKDSWFIFLTEKDRPGIRGIGECSIIPGLSPDDHADLELQIDHICKLISMGEMPADQLLPKSPSISFALETALKDLNQGGSMVLYPSEFTDGKECIRINGLIWMDSRESMLSQIRSKINDGFTVLKMKVGALDFGEELNILETVRKEYGRSDLEIRLDANGAWEVVEAIEKIEVLSEFGIHSIEQPIGSGQPEQMARVCGASAIPVALDEELIGVSLRENGAALLDKIKPAYIILKPGLLGGTGYAEKWIELVRERGIGWWVTSALESNIGLNAIAQWTATLDPKIPQGLGTGQLFCNNIPSPLEIKGEQLCYDPNKTWELTSILNR